MLSSEPTASFLHSCEAKGSSAEENRKQYRSKSKKRKRREADSDWSLPCSGRGGALPQACTYIGRREFKPHTMPDHRAIGCKQATCSQCWALPGQEMPKALAEMASPSVTAASPSAQLRLEVVVEHWRQCAIDRQTLQT